MIIACLHSSVVTHSMFRLLSNFLNNISFTYTSYNLTSYFLILTSLSDRKFIVSEHIVIMFLHVYKNLSNFEHHTTCILLDSLHICFRFSAGI